MVMFTIQNMMKHIEYQRVVFKEVVNVNKTKLSQIIRIIYFPGENLLSIVKAIADSPYLARPSTFKKDTLVFFDVYGFFMITYPSSFGLVLNCVACAIVLFGVISKTIIGQGQ